MSPPNLGCISLKLKHKKMVPVTSIVSSPRTACVKNVGAYKRNVELNRMPERRSVMERDGAMSECRSVMEVTEQ